MIKEESKKGKKEIQKVVKKALKKPLVKKTVTKRTIDKAVKKPIKILIDSSKNSSVKKEIIKKEPTKKESIKKELVKKIAKKPVKLVEKIDEKEEKIKKTFETPIIKEPPKGKEKKIADKQKDGDRDYYKGVGRRKRAVANVRLYPQGEKIFVVNNKPADIYFNNIEYQKIIYSSLEQAGVVNKFKIQALVRGGGLHAQSEAIRHGISRALLDFDKTLRDKLKIRGFLTRDPRRRERKKPGLKRARKEKQWRKR